MKTIQIIQRASDQKFWAQGHDCADQWTDNPLSATNVGGYMNLRDCVDGLVRGEGDVAAKLRVEGFTILEFKITAAPTGRKTEDLYREGIDISTWATNQAKKIPDWEHLDPEQQKAILKALKGL